MRRTPLGQRSGVRALIVVAGTIALALPLYGLRVALLFMGADEGDIPPASSIPPVPGDAVVLSADERCASGGCWWQVVVRPAPHESAMELAAEMGVLETVRIPGNLWDPRTITVESDAESAAGTVTVVARYWGS